MAGFTSSEFSEAVDEELLGHARFMGNLLRTGVIEYHQHLCLCLRETYLVNLVSTPTELQELEVDFSATTSSG